MKNNKRKYKQINIVTILFDIVIIFTFILALKVINHFNGSSKYVVMDNELKENESTYFFFESDIAEIGEGKEIFIDNWDGNGNKKIEFSVNNYIDSLQKSDEDITFNMQINWLNGDNLADIVCKDKNGDDVDLNSDLILDGDVFCSNKYSFVITPKNVLHENDEMSFEVTFTSKEPYEKTMKSVFNIKIKNRKSYEFNISDCGEYVKVYLKTYELQRRY